MVASVNRTPLASKILATTLAVSAALAIGEGLATWAFDGAYPTLNLYEADPRFGVRLTPDASTRVASPSGVVTEIRTNALGFRGGPWPAPSDAVVRGRVLIVGDSQVLGWGVPEGATFGALLGARGLDVLAAGVPTWGPGEYAAAIAELAPRYHPEHVVMLLNAANDWDEAPVPNVRRTTARDGWARVPLGPADLEPPTDFPGRRFLLGRSHLALAFRLLGEPKRSERPSALPGELARRFFDDLDDHLRPEPPYRSILGRHLARARAVCAAAGCELVAVYLPMDLQIDRGEWRKYGVPPRDVGPAAALTERARADAPDLVDLGPALVAVSPGAFLPDDYHLSAAGHAAVAAALAERLGARR